ncbi:MAG: RDD family protein [Verrucomicrobiota bacterium]
MKNSLITGKLAVLLLCTALGAPQLLAQLEDPLDKPAAERINRQDIVMVGQDFVLKANEYARDVVVVGGNAQIEGEIERDLVVVAGAATINGKINGDLVVVMGSANLGPRAELDQEAFFIGGSVKVDPKAKLNRGQVEVSLGSLLPDLTWLKDWFVKGILYARPLPPQVKWAWIAAGLALILYLLLAVLFPRPVQSCVEALEQRPASSFFVGILGFVLFGPVCLLLAITGIGLLVIPILFCALIAAVLFGKAAVYQYLGQQVGRQINMAVIQQPIIALLLGAAVFYLFYMIPVLGFVVWGAGILLALGAALLAISGSFVRETPNPVAAVPMAVVAPGILSGIPLSSDGGIPPAIAPAEPGPLAPPTGDMVYLARAGFWIRFWAMCLDQILFCFLWPLTGPLNIVLLVAYYVAMWTWKGTSIGGIVLGLKVVRTDGSPVNFAVALVRSLSSIFSTLVLFLGFFWAGWDSEKQSWHDKIAGTIVVKVPKGVSLI